MAKKAALITEQQFIDMKSCGLEVMWDAWYAGTIVTPEMLEDYLARASLSSNPKYHEIPDKDEASGWDIFFMAFVDDESSTQE